jgi:hypothetical protein
MSTFVQLAQFTLSNEWQYTDVVIGSYFRITHLTEPMDNGVAVESSAAIAQVDVAGFVYTQEDFTHQSEPQRFVLELPETLEVRRLGFRLLPGQMPWEIKVEALDATTLPGQQIKGDKGDKGDNASTAPSLLAIPNSDFHLTSPSIPKNSHGIYAVEGISGSCIMGNGNTGYGNATPIHNSKTFLIVETADKERREIDFDPIKAEFELYRIVFLGASRTGEGAALDSGVKWFINSTQLFNKTFNQNNGDWSFFDSGWISVPQSTVAALKLTVQNGTSPAQSVFFGEFKLYGKNS